MITIIDYNMGNPRSVANMFDHIGFPSMITSDPGKIRSAQKIVLPGVGAFDTGMEELERLGLIQILSKKILEEKTPVLGICLGMQLFTKESEEGRRRGLGWIDAVTKKFNFRAIGSERLRIPHMGWNTVALKKESRIFAGIGESPRFYFVHSFHLDCRDSQDITALTNYGYDFASAIEHENILGIQFHPEKSHKFGMRLLKNFAELY